MEAKYWCRLAALLAVIAVIGVGMANANDSAADPQSCLRDEGLSDVEQRDESLWRGFHQDPFYAVLVQKLANPAEAASLVADADLAVAAQSGSFVVTGPAPGAPGAREVVDAIAGCI
jgi:hypothetical protein